MSSGALSANTINYTVMVTITQTSERPELQLEYQREDKESVIVDVHFVDAAEKKYLQKLLSDIAKSGIEEITAYVHYDTAEETFSDDFKIGSWKDIKRAAKQINGPFAAFANKDYCSPHTYI